MYNSKFNKFVALFMSLVFSFGVISTNFISIKGYASDNPDTIAHNQNLNEANNEGQEESRLQDNGSQLPLTVFLGRTGPISWGNTVGLGPYLSKSDNNWWLLKEK